jgi:hypothetical protein
VQFGGGGTTYTGFASSSVPNFLGVGDTVTITSVLTEAADPDATINAGALPSNLNGATLPSTLLFDTVAVPEPGVLAFFAMGLPALLFLRKRRSL